MADPDRTVLTESDITDPGPLRTALNNSAGAGPVKSVNGKTGDVALSASDIGAVAATSKVIPKTQDLNTLTDPGRYIQGSSADTTLALNYPVDGFAGHIEVHHSNAMTMQRATYFTDNYKFGVWVRVLYSSSGSWGPWKRLDEAPPVSLWDSTHPDLNAVTTPGTYYLGSSAHAIANTPVPRFAGWVFVHGSSAGYAGGTLQIAHTIRSSGNTASNTERQVWWRSKFGAGSWGPWLSYVIADDPLFVDTGWRVLTSWTDTGVVTGEPLPTGIAPTAGVAGSVRVRRSAGFALWQVKGATWSGLARVTIPAGFRPSQPSRVVTPFDATTSNSSINGSSLYIGRVGDTADAIYGTSLRYFVGDTPAPAQPYPGTPA